MFRANRVVLINQGMKLIFSLAHFYSVDPIILCLWSDHREPVSALTSAVNDKVCITLFVTFHV